MNREKIGYLLIALLGISALITVLLLSPIKQPLSYHHFSDETNYFHTPNFLNVISNLPFLLTGLLGLFSWKSFPPNKSPYLLFFAGISLVSFGSGYYHLHPDNATLVWDRLPMTISFMALFSILIREFLNEKVGRRLLIPFLAIGLYSIYFWLKYDDLRIYVAVQFLPMLMIPVILLFFKSKYNLTSGYWWLLLAYTIAKFLEYFDYQIFDSTHFVSGHTLKHLFAAASLYILLCTYRKREEVGINVANLK
ncbi:ceramidase domain-containing protein [soil metagenome]